VPGRDEVLEFALRHEALVFGRGEGPRRSAVVAVGWELEAA
jgi:hypothetical protein